MPNQFFKAFILVVATASITYGLLTFFAKDNVNNSEPTIPAQSQTQPSSLSPSNDEPAQQATLDSNSNTIAMSKPDAKTQIEGQTNKQPVTANASQQAANMTTSMATAPSTEVPTNLEKPSQTTPPNNTAEKSPSALALENESQTVIDTQKTVEKPQQENSSVSLDAQNPLDLNTNTSPTPVVRQEAQQETESVSSSEPQFYTSTMQHLTPQPTIESVEVFCKELANKLRTVKYEGCLELQLGVEEQFRSVKDRSLTFRHFRPQKELDEPFNSAQKQTGRILFISGIHGDEYSAISITYLWMLNMLQHQDKNTQHWLFLPLTNPDGLFRSPATRINANNVDLNRNFPSPDWDELALDYWKKYYYSNKRRYPGKQANSEPETQWLVHLIEEFKPDAIISVHAPYGLVDYDGPEHAIPNRIGALKHRELGTYPGSLGRYAGEYLKIPVLTLELRAAGSMPSDDEIYNMWRDVENWTITKIRGEDPGAIPKFKKTNKDH